MTHEEWSRICDEVTDRMNDYVRPFVTPLAHSTDADVRFTGTGSFYEGSAGTMIATCAHCAIEAPLDYQPHGHEDYFRYLGDWDLVRKPIDAAWTSVPVAAPQLPARVIPSNMIAAHHALAQPEELLFFRGYADENRHFAFEVLEANGTGYLTQQNLYAEHDPQTIELLWASERAVWSEGTTNEARQMMRFENPSGFSGSLVWNTRFLETGADLEVWTPQQAVVTALLRGFAKEDHVLLATPVEVIRRKGGFR